MGFACDKCVKVFSTRSVLNRHRRNVHGDEITDKLPKPGSVSCVLCGKSFSSQGNVNQHWKNIHKSLPQPISYYGDTKNFACLEDGNCQLSFKTHQDLIFHLRDTHGKAFDTLSYTFNTEQEFQLWKDEIEEKYGVRYLKKSDKYYYCNRSKPSDGTKPRDNKKVYKRQLKSQGSRKLPFKCTSHIKKVLKDGLLEVSWIKTHYGHEEHELQHISLKEADKLNVVSKLINGVKPLGILQSQQDNVGEDLRRADLLTTKDIENIKKSYRLGGLEGKRHSNDVVSVDLWVEECSHKEENPVVFYKKQGVESDGFNKDDFCLIIMTSIQISMAKKFGNNIIAIDSTHGLNSYDFDLTTVMVVDEFSNGFPIAYMFANKKNTATYEFFFKCMRDLIGTLSVNTFMSDMDDTFHNGWVAVMGPPNYTLYCAWHVDRAWQSNLNKIHNLDKRHKVYEMMKVLQQDTPEQSFNVGLNNFLFYLFDDVETADFGKYFQQNYFKNIKKWAYCFRKHCGINTNMFLEAMHKNLKYFYLERKTVKRLDKGINVILQYVRDKTADRICKLTKGKPSPRMIFIRHNTALAKNYVIEVLKEGCEFLVKKCAEATDSYKVTKHLSETCCQLICKICNICPHSYSCTCPDAQKFPKPSICKHIHYIVLNMNSIENSNETKFAQKQNDDDDEVGLQVSLKAMKKDEGVAHSVGNSGEQIRHRLQELLKIDFSLLKHETQKEIERHISIISSLTTIHEETICNVNTERPSTTVNRKRHITALNRFISTKKKRKGKETMSRSNSETVINKSLLNGDVMHVTLQKDQNEHNYCRPI